MCTYDNDELDLEQDREWLDLDDDPSERSSTDLPKNDEAEEKEKEPAAAEQPTKPKDNKTPLILGCFAGAAALAIAALLVLNIPTGPVTLELPQTSTESGTETSVDDPHLQALDDAAATITKTLLMGQHTVTTSNGDKLMMTFEEGGSYTGPDKDNPVAYGSWELSADNNTIHVTYQDGHTAKFVLGQNSRGEITLTADWDTYTFVEERK